MAFPTLEPTSRDVDAGDYPVKTFKAQSGAEVRILYGSKRTGMSISLGYDNISDIDAESFVTHFDEVLGSYNTFTLPSAVTTGWTGAASALTAAATGNEWRYAEPPAITSVRPGRSSVRIKLLGVL
jgi:hypothetical protein